VFGIACMIYAISSEPFRLEYVTPVIGAAMILADILWPKERGPAVTVMFYVIMASMFVFPLVSAWGDPVAMGLMTVPAAYLIFMAMFAAGIVKGGADVKCLIVLAMVFPSYPVFKGLPMIAVPDVLIADVFQFSLMVLFHAALFSLSVGLYYIAVNVRRGDTDMPYMFLGYRMDVADAKGAHVWPMHKVVDGKAVRTRKAQDPGVISEIERTGEERIWVTAMVPFLVPVTIAIIFVAFVGNILFLLF